MYLLKTALEQNKQSCKLRWTKIVGDHDARRPSVAASSQSGLLES